MTYNICYVIIKSNFPLKTINSSLQLSYFVMREIIAVKYIFHILT